MREQAQKMTTEQQIAGLELQIKALKKALGHLLAWMPQSSVSPIRADEANTLINWMNGHD